MFKKTASFVLVTTLVFTFSSCDMIDTDTAKDALEYHKLYEDFIGGGEKSMSNEQAHFAKSLDSTFLKTLAKHTSDTGIARKALKEFLSSGKMPSGSAYEKQAEEMFSFYKDRMGSAFDNVLQSTKDKSGDLAQKHVQQEQQIAGDFIQGILNMAKNKDYGVTDGHVQTINGIGKEIVDDLMSFSGSADDVKSYHSDVNKQKLQSLAEKQNRLYDIFKNIGSKLESSTGTKLDSSVLLK
jgi:hypothetical protein